MMQQYNSTNINKAEGKHSESDLERQNLSREEFGSKTPNLNIFRSCNDIKFVENKNNFSCNQNGL